MGAKQSTFNESCTKQLISAVKRGDAERVRMLIHSNKADGMTIFNEHGDVCGYAWLALRAMYMKNTEILTILIKFYRKHRYFKPLHRQMKETLNTYELNYWNNVVSLT